MNCYLINANIITAFWGHGLLYLAASGDCECPQYANLAEAPMTIIPPEYQLTTCGCTEPGTLPFRVHAWFHAAEQPETITVHTASGAQKITVEAFPAELAEDLATPAVFTAKLAKDEVVGISPNSWDINRAINDAVQKLEKLHPGDVNATILDSGVVAAGSPVGIAFLYVRMKQVAASKRR